MKYDLHIHSALSPCADDDMTPANIAGVAKLNGLDIIAVADHNAADNLPATDIACRAYGVMLLPAIEVNTAEEIHLLTYFKTVDAALEMGTMLYDSLPDTPYNHEIWGRQLVMNEDDEILLEKEKLLTSASSYSIYDIVGLCQKLGGIAVPAHVDKDSYSLLAVLGFAPDDLPFEAFEVKRPEHTLEKLQQTGRLPASCSILTSSDAHTLTDIAQFPRSLSQNHPLRKLL